MNSTSLDRGPAISKDGLSLYFASSRPGGFGGEDIYVSQRETRDDEWGPSMNLGPIVNTADNEMVPAFSRDGHLMFFASNRPLGFWKCRHLGLPPRTDARRLRLATGGESGIRG